MCLLLSHRKQCQPPPALQISADVRSGEDTCAPRRPGKNRATQRSSLNEGRGKWLWRSSWLRVGQGQCPPVQHQGFCGLNQQVSAQTFSPACPKVRQKGGVGLKAISDQTSKTESDMFIVSTRILTSLKPEALSVLFTSLSSMFKTVPGKLGIQWTIIDTNKLIAKFINSSYTCLFNSYGAPPAHYSMKSQAFHEWGRHTHCPPGDPGSPQPFLGQGDECPAR